MRQRAILALCLALAGSAAFAQSGPITPGVSRFSRIASSAATTNATLVKSSAARVYKIFACNTATAAAYIHFTNAATAPVPGTTPVLFSRPLPAAATTGALNCQSFDEVDLGWYFTAGAGFWISTGGADTDATAVAAGQVVQLSVEFQ